MILLLFYTICVCAAIRKENSSLYTLVNWRDGNDLYLYCQVADPESRNTVIFRINETLPIYFGSPRSFIDNSISNEMLIAFPLVPELQLGLVVFTLLPKFEGTYYCGDPKLNVWSEGVGPLVANPALVGENYDVKGQVIMTVKGKNSTLLCPVQFGKLEQYYYVSWYYYNKGQFHHADKTNKFIISTGKFSTLTVVNIQEQDFTYYRCEVSVWNPATKQRIGSVTRQVQLENAFNWKQLLLSSFYAIGWYPIVSLLFLSLCCLRNCIQCSMFLANNVYSSKVKSKHSGNSLSENEALQYEMDLEHSDDFHLYQEQQLGTGAFGEVFRSSYRGKIYAAKKLHHTLVKLIEVHPSKSVPLTKFYDECDRLKELSHDNVIQYIKIFVTRTSNLPSLVMELMDSNLRKYLESCQPQLLPVFFQISIFLDIAKGLSFLHSKKIIHCDLCDTNVLLDFKQNTPRAIISDYIISRLFPDDIMNSVLNSLSHRQVYYPSEMTINFTYTESTDIYALGILGLQIVLTEIQISCGDLNTKIPRNNLLRDTILACLYANGHNSSEDIVKMIFSLKK